jgi:hypothetical protein
LISRIAGQVKSTRAVSAFIGTLADLAGEISWLQRNSVVAVEDV